MTSCLHRRLSHNQVLLGVTHTPTSGRPWATDACDYAAIVNAADCALVQSTGAGTRCQCAGAIGLHCSCAFAKFQAHCPSSASKVGLIAAGYGCRHFAANGSSPIRPSAPSKELVCYRGCWLCLQGLDLRHGVVEASLTGLAPAK